MAQEIYRKGDIVWVDLGETVGSEQGGVRPAVIIQNDVGNKFSPCVIVGLITSREKKEMPTHVRIENDENSGLYKPSTILLEQIHTVDKSRISKKIGSISQNRIESINRALCVSLGMV